MCFFPTDRSKESWTKFVNTSCFYSICHDLLSKLLTFVFRLLSNLFLPLLGDSVSDGALKMRWTWPELKGVLTWVTNQETHIWYRKTSRYFARLELFFCVFLWVWIVTRPLDIPTERINKTIDSAILIWGFICQPRCSWLIGHRTDSYIPVYTMSYIYSLFTQFSDFNNSAEVLHISINCIVN